MTRRSWLPLALLLATQACAALAGIDEIEPLPAGSRGASAQPEGAGGEGGTDSGEGGFAPTGGADGEGGSGDAGSATHSGGSGGTSGSGSKGGSGGSGGKGGSGGSGGKGGSGGGGSGGGGSGGSDSFGGSDTFGGSGGSGGTSSGGTSSGGTSSGGTSSGGTSSGASGGAQCLDAGLSYKGSKGCSNCFADQSGPGGCCQLENDACAENVVCNLYGQCISDCNTASECNKCNSSFPEGFILYEAYWQCLVGGDNDDGVCGLCGG